MNFTMLLDILFELLKKRKTTAKALAEKYGVSTRTVHRYLDLLAKSVPLSVTQGRNGGVALSDCYKLPAGFLNEEEYSSAMDALDFAYAQTTDERFLNARRKLSAQEKLEKRNLSSAGESGLVYVDGVWSVLPAFFDKLTALDESVRGKTVLTIQYQHQNGEKEECKIEPHALILQNNRWLLFAFCYTKRAFRAFSVGRILSVVNTQKRFLRREYSRSALPLELPDDSAPLLLVKFEISARVLSSAYDWFGVENVYSSNGKHYAEVFLADENRLVLKILQLGEGVKVVSPDSLKKRIAKTAESIFKTYS